MQRPRQTPEWRLAKEGSERTRDQGQLRGCRSDRDQELFASRPSGRGPLEQMRSQQRAFTPKCCYLVNVAGTEHLVPQLSTPGQCCVLQNHVPAADPHTPSFPGTCPLAEGEPHGLLRGRAVTTAGASRCQDMRHSQGQRARSRDFSGAGLPLPKADLEVTQSRGK